MDKKRNTSVYLILGHAFLTLFSLSIPVFYFMGILSNPAISDRFSSSDFLSPIIITALGFISFAFYKVEDRLKYK